ncbi:MAG: hypothetical protein LBP58_06895 [Azoarcus sp.]|jgi:hypothetical protein|nr:hypothetical protein [Azoarcus sp.]
MIPGLNLLGVAMRIVGAQAVTYYRNTGRITSETGRDVAEYAAPVVINTGSVQPLGGERYAEAGIDQHREYVTWWVPADVLGIGRDISGDIIEYGGARYQCQHATSWFAQDGWKEVVCVLVGRAGGHA